MRSSQPIISILCTKANSPSFAQNFTEFAQNSVSETVQNAPKERNLASCGQTFVQGKRAFLESSSLPPQGLLLKQKKA